MRTFRQAIESAQKIFPLRKRRREEEVVEAVVEEAERTLTSEISPDGGFGGPAAAAPADSVSSRLKPHSRVEESPQVTGEDRVPGAADTEEDRPPAPSERAGPYKGVFSPMKTSSLSSSRWGGRRPHGHARALDQYAYLKSVQTYEDSLARRYSSSTPARPALTPVVAASGALDAREEQAPVDTTSRRLSYGTPFATAEPPSASRGVVTPVQRGGSRSLVERRLVEQERLENENSILRSRIAKLERYAAPVAVASATASGAVESRSVLADFIDLSSIFGDGVNSDLLRKKLERIDISVPSLAQYRRRQTMRRAQVKAHERTIESLRAEGNARMRTSLGGRDEIPEVLDESSTQERPTEVDGLAPEGGDDDVIDLGDDDEEDVVDDAVGEEWSADDGVDADPADVFDDEAQAGISVLDEEDSFSELTEAASRRVTLALSEKRPRHTTLSTMKNMTLCREDFLRLRPGQWLNDELMNCYLTLLQERNDRVRDDADVGWPDVHFLSTFFYTRLVSPAYDYSGVRRWTRRVDVFAKDKIIVPINLGNVHWACASIDLRSKELTYLDSMGGKNTAVLGHLRRWLEDESKDKKKTTLNCEEDGWELVTPGSSVPQQSNLDDCGVFTIKFADFSSRDAALSFSASDMGYFRRRTAAELIAKRAC